MEMELQGTDRLSELPDSVLIHILSFMDMDSVVPTSLLSKRWRNLWKLVLDMDFQCLWPTSLYRSQDFVDRSLALHQGLKINKFRICAEHDICPPERVDSWVSFAVQRNVEQLHLNFLPTYGDELDMNIDDRYETPHYIFNCSSLVSLLLRRCKINLPASLCLPALSSLTLERVDLAAQLMKNLISGCPLLEDLTLYDCNRREDLNIFAQNPRLKRLKLIEWDYLVSDQTKIEIFAPNLLSLEITDHMPRESYVVKNLSSLSVASFSFDALLDKECYSTTNFVRLLDQIHHVKVLKLCSGCIMELSIRETRDSNASVTFSLSTLVLKTGFCKFELPGLVYMLNNFFNLEILTVDVEETDESFKFEEYFQEEYEFDETEYWKSVDTSFSNALQHLKTVKIHGICMRTEYMTEKSKAVEVKDVEKQRIFITDEEVVEGILEEKGNMIDFIRILLKNKAVLERQSITIKHERYYANLVFIL